MGGLNGDHTGPLLRNFAAVDIPPLATIANDAEVARYLTARFPHPYSLDDARWWVETGSRQGIVRAIEVAGRLAGTIGVTPGEFEYARAAEIGYWLGRAHWGRGIATAALREMTRLVFATTDIERLYAPVFAPNHASMRVLEKCGYELEGVLRRAVFKAGVYYDTHLYARIRG